MNARQKLAKWLADRLTARADNAENAIRGGVRLISAERFRQIIEEGWNPEHDDHFVFSELAMAAGAYLRVAARPDYDRWSSKPPPEWPWSSEFWKPGIRNDTVDCRIRNLTKAGALIAAEIDRLQRLKDRMT